MKSSFFLKEIKEERKRQQEGLKSFLAFFSSNQKENAIKVFSDYFIDDKLNSFFYSYNKNYISRLSFLSFAINHLMFNNKHKELDFLFENLSGFLNKNAKSLFLSNFLTKRYSFQQFESFFELSKKYNCIEFKDNFLNEDLSKSALTHAENYKFIQLFSTQLLKNQISKYLFNFLYKKNMISDDFIKEEFIKSSLTAHDFFYKDNTDYVMMLFDKIKTKDIDINIFLNHILNKEIKQFVSNRIVEKKIQKFDIFNDSLNLDSEYRGMYKRELKELFISLKMFKRLNVNISSDFPIEKIIRSFNRLETENNILKNLYFSEYMHVDYVYNIKNFIQTIRNNVNEINNSKNKEQIYKDIVLCFSKIINCYCHLPINKETPYYLVNKNLTSRVSKFKYVKKLINIITNDLNLNGEEFIIDIFQKSFKSFGTNKTALEKIQTNQYFFNDLFANMTKENKEKAYAISFCSLFDSQLATKSIKEILVADLNTLNIFNFNSSTLYNSIEKLKMRFMPNDDDEDSILSEENKKKVLLFLTESQANIIKEMTKQTNCKKKLSI